MDLFELLYYTFLTKPSPSNVGEDPDPKSDQDNPSKYLCPLGHGIWSWCSHEVSVSEHCIAIKSCSCYNASNMENNYTVAGTAQSTDAMYRYPYQFPNQGCPNCGYCPHCGRSNQTPQYQQPFFPQAVPTPYCGPSTTPFNNLDWQAQSQAAPTCPQVATCNSSYGLL